MDQNLTSGIFVMNRMFLIGVLFICCLTCVNANDDVLDSFTKNKTFSSMLMALTLKNERLSGEKSYAIQNYTDGSLIPAKTRKDFHRVFKEYPLLKFEGYKFDNDVTIPDIHGYIIFERKISGENKDLYYVHFGPIDTVTIKWYRVQNNLKKKMGSGKYLWFDSERLMMKLCSAAYANNSIYKKESK